VTFFPLVKTPQKPYIRICMLAPRLHGLRYLQMGIQLNPGHGKGSGAAKGVYMRLFSDFFISDIILASPIGLRLAIGAPVKDKKANKDKKTKPTELSPDFLSSVEMVLMPQADVMYMQNWEHVDFVLRHTNKLPTAAHDTDYSRVRQYFLEGRGARHRQLVMSSHFNEPELQAFFREYAQSLAGSVRLKRDWGKGQLSRVVSSAKQVFQLVPGAKNFESQEEARFKYFKESVLAPVLRLEQKHTLIVTPSYLQYIRVRNELMSQEVRVPVHFPVLPDHSPVFLDCNPFCRSAPRSCASTVETARSPAAARVSSTASKTSCSTPAAPISSGKSPPCGAEVHGVISVVAVSFAGGFTSAGRGT
jgi:hypothetical protein